MNDKKLKGQFFTVRSKYILSGLSDFIKNKTVIDPFAGNKDLLLWAKENGADTIIGFDIDDKYIDNKIVFKNDSLLNPAQNYKFILTNPPYLHKNKTTQEIKESYFSNNSFEDLYQVSINSIMNSEEGIMIVPLNFLSAENSTKIRHLFFQKFKIQKLNIFQEQVFEDTTYNVISFYYKKRREISDQDLISAKLFPSQNEVSFVLKKKYDWQFGGEFITKINNTKNHLKIYRLTEDKIINGEKKIELAFNNIKQKKEYKIDESFEKTLQKNIIFLRAIDSKNGKKIQLEDIRNYKVPALVGKNTSRNMAYLLFGEKLDIKIQELIINEFNRELNKARDEYNSFLLTNFRDNDRKRISFDLAYKLINFIYFNKINTKRQGCIFESQEFALSS